MKKKKLLALGMVAAMATTAVVGGTLAYFTDTDSAENVFTIGNVSIEQIEQQRKYDAEGKLDTTTLEDFEDDKVLVPIVGNVQNDPKDAWGMPTSANFQDKIVSVTNTGKSDAYVRTFVAVPKVLVDVENALLPTADMSENPLHDSLGNRFDKTASGTYNDPKYNWRTHYEWDYDNRVEFEAKIENIDYIVTCYTHKTAVKAQETTNPVIVGCYLDNDVDYDSKTGKYFIWTDNDEDGVKTDKTLLQNFSADGKIHVLVATQAVQADGFNDAYTAFEASFGNAEIHHPWAENDNTQYNVK